MGSEYVHYHLHHRQCHRKTIFLPMFCRLSIKDIITLNHHRKNPISAAAAEPSSPRVSCMGQVKRNNSVTGFPAASTAAAHHRTYSKLKRLFSGKTLLPPATASGGGGRTRSKSFRLGEECKQDCAKVVNISEIDPPLPVVKRVAPPIDAANLWRRRFNGAAALKGLQIEQIITRLPNSDISSQQPTV